MNWKERADRCIAQGALTNSKHPSMLIRDVYPTHVSHGTSCYLYDTDNSRYVDFICGLGANFLGYGNDKITQHILKNVYNGFSHSLPTTQEVLTAENLKNMFPFVTHWKFLKSGSEACTAAIKFARAATSRFKVISHGYHGMGDLFVSLQAPHVGVPHDTNIEKYFDLSQIDNRTAAVIIEPVVCDDTKDNQIWLNALRTKCTKVGAMLIFDEIITGFRFKKWSVANAYGIVPDLLVIGKAMANGMPLAAVGGKQDIMNNPRVFVSSTYAGETMSLASCQKVCDLLVKDNDYKIDYLWEKGQEFMDKFNAQETSVKMKGYPTRGIFEGNEVEIASFMAEMAKAKILFHKSWFFTWGHIKEMDNVLEIARIVKQKIANGLKFEHQMPESPFSMGARK
jgi:glutamate-1-semialdehyde aminotransferase